ncbi:MAG: NAD(P)H-dependent oxidoreductase subunit E [Thermoleophilia bacterium]|jgi:NADH-quinone oxidoreductase subunit E
MTNKIEGDSRMGQEAGLRGSALYEVLKGIDFERRELVGARPGSGLIGLTKKEDDGYRCYSCTLCERTCPVDCISIEYQPEAPEQKAVPSTEPQPDIDMKLFDPVVAGIRSGSGLIEALHATQNAYGYLPRVILENIADEMRVPFSRVFGVASFYNQFRLQPVGKHVIDVCMGTACHVAGAPLVVEALSLELGVPVGATTPDGLFTIQTVNCVGACALAPVVRLGTGETIGRVGPSEARRLVRRLQKQEVAS